MGAIIVIAPDSFKGSMTAAEAARAIAQGWCTVRPEDRIVLAPQADGGEGTLDAFEASVPDAVRHHVGDVCGPDGRPTPGEWLELPGAIAVVELAQCSGLPLMAELDPLGATTRGLGEVIQHALASGANSLLIGLGGSASTDGGAGALSALGLVLHDVNGHEVARGAAGLRDVHHILAASVMAPPAGGVTLLTDVIAPLLGPTGAAAVFGPQKGASVEEVGILEDALRHFLDKLGGRPQRAGMGAAGGTAYGFATAWNANIELGADHLARLSGLESLIAVADMVISGEGKFDAQSSTGKVVGNILERASEHGVRAGVVAGQISVETAVWNRSLVDLAGSVEQALADPGRWLSIAGEQAARCFSLRS